MPLAGMVNPTSLSAGTSQPQRGARRLRYRRRPQWQPGRVTPCDLLGRSPRETRLVVGLSICQQRQRLRPTLTGNVGKNRHSPEPPGHRALRRPPRPLRPARRAVVPRSRPALAEGDGPPRSGHPHWSGARRGHRSGWRGTGHPLGYRSPGGRPRPHRPHVGAGPPEPPHPKRARCASHPGEGRGAPVRRRSLRRRHFHLPPALRGRPGGHRRRAGPGGAARRHTGQPRVPPPPGTLVAWFVVGLHPFGAAGGRVADRRTRVVRGRPLSGAAHLASLPALPVVVDGGCLEASRHRGRREPPHVVRRGTRHVGDQARWQLSPLTPALSPPTPEPAPAYHPKGLPITPPVRTPGGATCELSSIRRIPPGTSPTW